MDVNESVLPNLKVYEPLIPREVMISLGLNRLEKEEEIQRYHFKRLIAGAKNVHLVYLQRDDKEKSRFIEELIWERQKERNSFDVLTITQGGFTVKVLPKRLEIKKNPQILKFLRNYEYSASSLNYYLHCPLKFYYQYVLGLKEKEDLLEEAEGKDIGTFIHELLNERFAKFIAKRPFIDERFEKDFFVALDKKFADEFEKKMKSDAFLIKEVLDFRLKRFLKNERQRNVRKILCLEKTFKGSIQLKAGNFKFQAIIDRIDQLDDLSLLVIDYKTGGADIMPQVDLERIESAGLAREVLKNSIKSFQLPLYLYFVSNDEKYKANRVNACLYSIKEIDERTLGLNMLFKGEEQLANKEKIMHTYLKALDSILCEIINPDIPFKADEEDARQCANCPFFYMCR
jgi:ATP-dependent helicase/DNAse subunit B